MISVRYIVGAGRSGSTLLERTLSSAPGVAALGEAHCLWRATGLACACGAPVAECPFWTETRARAGLDDAALAELAAIERAAIRHKAIAVAGFSLKRYQANPLVRRFRARQRDLFEAAAEVAGARSLVDSSKAAPRAWALAGVGAVAFLRLTRRPGDVAASWRREKFDPALGGPMRRKGRAHALGEWARAEASALILGAQTPIEAIAYEDFVAAPAAALASLSGDPGAGVAWRGPRSFRPDENYHAINGNPMRFQTGEIEIRPLQEGSRTLGEAVRNAA